MTNTETLPEQNYGLPAFLYIASIGLERAGYYGLRAILILYMMSDILYMDQGVALSIYSILATVIVFTQILGGVVGDLILGNRNTAFLGGVIQAIGAFVLCIPSVVTLYIGVGLISLGSGLYSPNVLANFGKLHAGRERKMDSGYTLFYTSLNLGAFLGVLLIGALANINFMFGFLASGILILAGAVLLILVQTKSLEKLTIKSKNTLSNQAILVIIAIILSSLFWGVYELGGSFKYFALQDLIGELDSSLSFGLLEGISNSFLIIVGVIGVIVWWFSYVNRFIKLGIGFIAGALAFVLFLLLPETGAFSRLAIFLVSVLLLGIAEIGIAPTINSIIATNTNSKYLAIVFSVVFLPVRLLYYLNSLFAQYNYDRPLLGVTIGCILLFVVGAVILVGYFVIKNNSKPSVT